mgnify:CR=1 FL=1
MADEKLIDSVRDKAAYAISMGEKREDVYLAVYSELFVHHMMEPHMNGLCIIYTENIMKELAGRGKIQGRKDAYRS